MGKAMNDLEKQLVEMFMGQVALCIVRGIKHQGVRGLMPRRKPPLSIMERRIGVARGTAYRRLPDPNPNVRRKTDRISA
jgi:hypothetical protein